MCEYAHLVQQAIQELAEELDSFDMLQIRDRTRVIAGPSTDVRFRPCKFEALASFERGLIPGFVLTTKTIELETDTPLVDNDGKFSTEDDGALVTETIQRSVFSFTKISNIVHEALAPQHGYN